VRVVVLDIETDAIDATVIHCVVTLEDNDMRVWTDPVGLSSYLEDATVVAHNGLSFDFPVLARLWGVRLKFDQMVDTLVLSMLDKPDREKGHSLKAWGIRLGEHKQEFDEDFTRYTPKMLEYCKQDVVVCSKVYRVLSDQMKEFSEQSIRDEHRMRIVADRVSKNGFRLNLTKAIELHNKIQIEQDRISAECIAMFPPIVEERHSEKTGKRLKDKITEFNPSSRQQIAQRLLELGWKPTDLTPSGKPKVDEKTLQNSDLPVAQKLARYFLLQKRSALIKAWIKASSVESRVHCRYRTLGAVTNRMSCVSPNLQQVPAVRSEYGTECRSLWEAGRGNVLIDTDAAGLELRVLAHYMNDPKFTKEVLEGDVHTTNQQMAGLETRAQAKTFIYALLYGAGDAKIGSVVNGSAKDGAELRERFMENMPSYRRLSEAVTRKGQSQGKLMALDGRVLRVRSAHASLNTLIQGSSAVLMKKWFMYVDYHLRRRKLDAKIVAMVHDELVLETSEKDVDHAKDCVILSIRQVNKAYKLNCELDCDVQTGNNWSEIH
jgi:DNA polymerase I-like protein with 3'-5' exonuclease and polymerase domains